MSMEKLETMEDTLKEKREKHNKYMREYRAKLKEKFGTTYTENQKKYIKKYSNRIMEEAKMFREMQAKGLLSVEAK